MILGKSDGTTLQEHINDCLLICKQLKTAIPAISEVTGKADFFEVLVIAILFHDFGKIHPEFQKELRKLPNHWDHERHEIYSVAFTNKLQLDKFNLDLIQKAILAHHKSFFELKQKYQTSNEIKDDFELNWKHKSLYHPHDFYENLKHIPNVKIAEIVEFITAKFYGYKLKYNLKKIKYSNISHPVELFALLNDSIPFSSREYLQNLIFWGALKMCDHYGSAGIDSLPVLEKKHFTFLEEINEPYKHQKEAWNCDKDVILIAPTGSGKTESAIGWLKNQLDKNTGKVYYILPYTASINAMHKRLVQSIEKVEPINAKLIGLQHGKLSHYLANLVEGENEYVDLKKKSDIFRKLIHPLRIVTPFQILKYFFGVKGFEIGFVNLCGAFLIFDEIHAYDINTFAQIMIMLEFLIQRFKCKIFIMTATLPSFMVEEIMSILPQVSLIKPEKDFLEKVERHKIEIYDGNIFDAIDYYSASSSYMGRAIVVCNTVAQAQECYRRIIKVFPHKKTVLLHSRFNSLDRMNKENLAFDQDTDFLIGTQAIEVSLDIDYDIIITEPAPLDALLQRFGRVNRYGKKLISPAILCTKGGKFDYKIYPNDITQRTIKVLSNVDILKEIDLQDLLDQVYPCFSDEQAEEYNNIKTLFKNSLASLQPYSEHQESEEAFYEKFTGIQVLPAKFFGDYKKLIEREEFLKAEELLVGIHHSTYRSLKYTDDGSRISLEPITIMKNNKTFNYHVIVAKCKYDEFIGLDTSEFCDIPAEDNFF